MVKRHAIGAATSLCLLLAAGAVHAQTNQAEPLSPPAAAPNAGTPNAITPPGGVARGVIRPSRPVDRGMVTRPPNHGHTMPVIKPPGTAR